MTSTSLSVTDFLAQVTLQSLRNQFGVLLYQCGGRVPFTQGYGVYRDRYIKRILADETLLRAFQRNRQLPAGFGMALDERVVEYPWALSRLLRYPESSRLLDAGSTFNYHMILSHHLVRNHKWTILTLAPESSCFWRSGVSYVYDDFRSMPFRDQHFDAVFSVSVIEHVGMDNVLYTGKEHDRQKRSKDYLLAIDQIKRVLRPGGWLFLTVPYGLYEDHGWLQQFDAGMLSELISRFRPQAAEQTFYSYSRQGWQITTADQCSEFRYVINKGKSVGFRRQFRKDPAFAAAARGVACIALQK